MSIGSLALPSPRVLIVGDLMLDEYLVGQASRISPEAPVPVVEVTQRKYVLGGAANVASNIVGLGAQAFVLGIIGNDLAGEKLSSLLTERGIESTAVVVCPNRPTTCKSRVMSGQQQIVRFDCEERSALSSPYQDRLLTAFHENLALCDICIFSDYGKGVLSDQFCRIALPAAKAAGKPVIVDPKGSSYEKYRDCSLITPNLKEASQAAHVDIEKEQDLFQAGKTLLHLLPGSAVLVTRGADGMTLFRDGHSPVTIPTAAQTVFDVVGAGDTAVAALAVSLAQGFSMEIAMRLSNAAAGVAVGKHGTVAVTQAEWMEHPEVRPIFHDRKTSGLVRA